ncbi:porin [Aequorivita echinoideorum]|uniref:Porin n=1 Tax=Aequorivita echinoideorum TaxID=1549647 RepID=A0ABS5S3N6_9FLAO|nr:porin [Aequorivita echinoideorum]MBT0607820.1 porin [Aequorivita echinoideorum]
MYRTSCLLGLMLLFAYTVPAQETSSKFGNGMVNYVAKDSSWSVKFAPRIQFRANSLWLYEGTQFGKPEQDYQIRRARLKFDGFAYTPKLRYKFELGLSSLDMAGASEFTANAPRIIYDAVIKWKFYKNVELWAGQTKLPGNRERVISSADMQLVDRSVLNRVFNIDRDVGFQLRHFFSISEEIIIREIFALSQGEGRNVVTGNLGGHQYTGRIEVLPFGNFTKRGDYIGGDIYREKNPKLSIGATYDYNDNAVKTRSNMGAYMRNDIGFFETDISTIFVDAMFKYEGFSFMGEYSHRQADNPIATNSDGTLTGQEVYEGDGLNLQCGYLFDSNWEVAGRYSTVLPDTEFFPTESINEYTFGISKYIVGHKLKFQTDITYGTIGNTSNLIEYRMGFDLHF